METENVFELLTHVNAFYSILMNPRLLGNFDATRLRWTLRKITQRMYNIYLRNYRYAAVLLWLVTLNDYIPTTAHEKQYNSVLWKQRHSRDCKIKKYKFAFETFILSLEELRGIPIM